MSESDLKIILATMRPPFLLLPPVCVLLGLSTAVYSGSEISALHVALAFIGALASHISVNALNEYSDFKSGLDFRTEPTPFSGGSKTLPKNPQKAHLTLISGLVTLGITAGVGAYFLAIRGLWLLPIGGLGVLVIAAYTPIITRNATVCLIAPGLGFGTFMVMGTHFVLSGHYTWASFVASLVPFFLVSNLLLINQFPDVDADRGVGRNHFPIVIGRKKSAWIFNGFHVATYLSVISGWILGVFPVTALIALLSLVLAFPTMAGASRYADDIPNLMPTLAKNVILNLVTPVLLAVGLLIG